MVLERLIPRSNKDFIARPLSGVVTRSDLVSSESLSIIPVLLAFWSRKIFPLVVSFYIWSYTVTIVDLIWNYILFYQRPQSHIWQCKKQQFCKTGEIQIT